VSVCVEHLPFNVYSRSYRVVTRCELFPYTHFRQTLLSPDGNLLFLRISDLSYTVSSHILKMCCFILRSDLFDTFPGEGEGSLQYADGDQLKNHPS
jgi:hypothetical protein